VTFEYTMRYIRVQKKGWRELGEVITELPAEDWELFMAVPITEVGAYWFGLSGGRTTAIIHYFRRPIP